MKKSLSIRIVILFMIGLCGMASCRSRNVVIRAMASKKRKGRPYQVQQPKRRRLAKKTKTVTAQLNTAPLSTAVGEPQEYCDCIEKVYIPKFENAIQDFEQKNQLAIEQRRDPLKHVWNIVREALRHYTGMESAAALCKQLMKEEKAMIRLMELISEMGADEDQGISLLEWMETYKGYAQEVARIENELKKLETQEIENETHQKIILMMHFVEILKVTALEKPAKKSARKQLKQALKQAGYNKQKGVTTLPTIAE